MGREITVWWCDECGYWRKEKSTGVHQTTNPRDPNGRLVGHDLRALIFVAKDDSAPREESDAR